MEPLEKLIGARLRFARQSRSLTQEQLAEEIGATVGSIRNWENARSTPPSDVASRACQALRVSADWLLGLTDSDQGLPAGKIIVDARLVERVLGAKTSRQLEPLLDGDPDPVLYAIPIPEGARLMDQRDADAVVRQVTEHLHSFPEALANWKRKLR